MQEQSPRTAALSLKVLACLALCAGLVVGLLALFATFGVWLGWWDFRQGFRLLGLANAAAPWVALITLAIAVLVFFGAHRFRTGNGAALLSLALLGTIAAALVYYVPESYRPPEGTPAIHDISTDTENPPGFVDIVPLRADAPNSHEYGDSPADITPEKLAELQQQAYPDIQPRTFSQSRDLVFDRAVQVAEELGWELVAQVPEEGRIEATDTTFWFRFKDDVVIRIRQENGQTVVDARSVSRVGVSDVGKNAERLRRFFERLEREVAQAS